MKEEKPLSEKRKELRNKIVDGHHIYWEEVFDVIEQQDAEAVKKLKERSHEYMSYGELLRLIDKIMGNFNHYSLDNKTVTKNKDTTVSNSKDKGCGEKYCWENKDFQVITMIIPKCEIGLKEDKQ